MLEIVKKKNMKRQKSFFGLNNGAGSSLSEKKIGNMKPVKGLNVAPVSAIAALMLGTATAKR